jgi:hypothetical protein
MTADLGADVAVVGSGTAELAAACRAADGGAAAPFVGALVASAEERGVGIRAGFGVDDLRCSHGSRPCCTGTRSTPSG